MRSNQLSYPATAETAPHEAKTVSTEPRARIELATPSLPWKCSTTELSGRNECIAQTHGENFITSRSPEKQAAGMGRLNVVRDEERIRVDGHIVDVNLKVQVSAGRHSRVANKTENIAELDGLTHGNRN